MNDPTANITYKNIIIVCKAWFKYLFILILVFRRCKIMLEIDKNNLILNFCERQDVQKTRLNTAVYMKTQNDNYYFTTIPKQNNKFKDLVVYNPKTNEVILWDLKKYLNTLLAPAIINDNDLLEIKKYLTHLRGDHKRLLNHVKKVRYDDIIKTQIEEELEEKERLKKHYKIIRGPN